MGRKGWYERKEKRQRGEGDTRNGTDSQFLGKLTLKRAVNKRL